MRIVWHFDAAGEPHTYTVAYRFRGLAVAYDDVVDVNLKVWGDELGGAARRAARDDDVPAAGGARRRATASGATRPG